MEQDSRTAPEPDAAGTAAGSGGLTLRPLADADVELLVTLLPNDFDHDPTVPRDPATSLAEHRRGWFRGWLEAMLPGGRLAAWVPFVAELGGAVVGLQVLKWDPGTRTADSTSWLVPGVRRQGHGVTMRRLALAYAFDVLGADRAVTSARPDNAASLRVSERVGYRVLGTRDHDVAGASRPLVHLELTRADFQARRDQD